jgi:hypothetical protein
VEISEAPAMRSLDLIRDNLQKRRDRVLAHIEDMRDHAVVFPTPNGGCHTLWTLGHLACIELLVVRTFMRGEANPLAHWEATFDGADVSGDISTFPSFDDVLATCRDARQSTIVLLDALRGSRRDAVSAGVTRRSRSPARGGRRRRRSPIHSAPSCGAAGCRSA